MVLTSVREYSELMTKMPSTKAMIPMVIMRRRCWGAMGRSPPGRNFFNPF